MLDKIAALEKKFHELQNSLIQPEILADPKRAIQLNKEYKELQKVMKAAARYKTTWQHLEEAKQVLRTEKEEEFRQLAKDELPELEAALERHEEELKLLLIPKDPNDSKNVVLEFRAGAGGNEAAIFAGDLFRMYQRFAEKMRWKFQIIDYIEGTAGGYKEIVATVSGTDVYGMLKYESGVHRVQRVPTTETQGRIHTSAASVVVLPEADEVEVNLDMNDVRKDTFCSSGPGGQSVNTTYSAIRLTHLPTGLVVSCQDEKSQLKNLDKALKVLRARLYELELKKHQESVGAERRSMVGSGDRSDKIRTYNYPQGRVTDHRIGYTVHNLPAIMDGDIGAMIEALRIADRTKKLQTGSND